MIQRSIAFAVVAVLAAGLGAGGALALAGAPNPGAHATTLDRAGAEALLRERTVKPTGVVRRYQLTAADAQWELLPGVTTRAATYNGSVPGPTLRVTEGDTLEVAVTNRLAEPTSVHWHGVHVPNDQDGVAGITQEPIAPGATFTYRFVAPHAGTFMYHPHADRSRAQIDRGLYGTLIIDPAGGDPVRPDADVTLALQGWMVGGMDGMSDAMSMEYNYFTVNGKSYPATVPITLAQDQLLRLRFINPSQTIHPMHLHGTDMLVVAKDGEPLGDPQRINTLTLNAGETYEVLVRADNPGQWLLHCHDLHHASNNGQEPGGLIVPITVTAVGGTAAPSVASRSSSPVPSLTPMMSAMPGMTH